MTRMEMSFPFSTILTTPWVSVKTRPSNRPQRHNNPWHGSHRVSSAFQFYFQFYFQPKFLDPDPTTTTTFPTLPAPTTPALAIPTPTTTTPAPTMPASTTPALIMPAPTPPALRVSVSFLGLGWTIAVGNPLDSRFPF